MAKHFSEGPFANDGERKVARELTNALPPNAVVISNLYLPNGKSTLEIDLVVVTALGVGVIEVKDWTGTVRFTGTGCTRDDEHRDDPRPGVSYKAKVLHGRLGVVTAELVVLARDATRLVVDADGGVPVKRLSDAVDYVRSGRIFSQRARGSLSDREIRSVVETLRGAHDVKHRRSLNGYVFGDETGRMGEHEIWATEIAAPENRVRLRRYVVDQLASASERDEEHRAAKRAFEVLRKLQPKRVRQLPLMYACFADPNDDATIWTAYEGVDGPDILTAKLDVKQRVLALAQVAEALAICHDAGVIHRALSPDAILVPVDATTPVILNFELARLVGAATIAAGRSGAKLRGQTRLAPELRRSGANATPAADVFSLGITTIESVTGARVKTLAEAREAARKLKPRELAAVTLRMIEEQPSKRFADMRSVAEALRKAVRA